MPFTTRTHTRTEIVRTRKPTLINRILHPSTTPSTHSKRHRATHTRTRATGPAPMSHHRKARTKPTLGSRIHGMAKKVLGTMKGDRAKKNAGTAMMKGYTPGSRRTRNI